MSYQKCPCCDGWGVRVHIDRNIPGRKNPKITHADCASCKGTGLVGFPPMASLPTYLPPNAPFIQKPVEWTGDDLRPDVHTTCWSDGGDGFIQPCAVSVAEVI